MTARRSRSEIQHEAGHRRTDRLAHNPDEALSALAYLIEAHDEAGRYLSAGKNGVAVSHAYGSCSYDFLWDISSETGARRSPS
jgi:hypothetical protein